MDDKGRVLTQFTDVDQPRYLSATSEDGLLVADWGKSCILLLNNKLNLERVPLDCHVTLNEEGRLTFTHMTTGLTMSQQSVKMT